MTDPKIIDAVARAMAAATGHDPDMSVAPENDDPTAPVLMVAIPLWCRYRKEANILIAAHTTALMNAGYVIVPMEPTGEMKDAGAETLLVYREPQGWVPLLDGQPSKAWRAMIAAAPKPGGS